jgi:hypothetical protein
MALFIIPMLTTPLSGIIPGITVLFIVIQATMEGVLTGIITNTRIMAEDLELAAAG